MTEPYIGQIEIFGFNFAPYQWAFAAGQLIPIRQNTALFSLIGTIYGGDGQTTFALPNLASCQACGSGQGPGLTDRQLGELFGAFSVSLTTEEMPAHTHEMDIQIPNGDEVAAPGNNAAMGTVYSGNFMMYAQPATAAPMSPMMLQPAGSSLPHNNTQPYLGVNYSIALAGNFPAFS